MRNVKAIVEIDINLKQFDKIRNKINNLEEINFTPEEYHQIFLMAGMDLLSNSEMRTLILAFC